LVFETGVSPSNALEDFTVNLSKTKDNDFTQVSLQGTIQGVDTRDYGVHPGGSGTFDVTESKYTSALTYWTGIQSRLLSRIQKVGQDDATRNFNVIPLSKTVGHGYNNGVITYNYEYDDRPSNCIAGSLMESISIQDNNPLDVFASLTVLGRAVGPVLQDLATQTVPTRDVNVNVTMAPATGCTATQLRTINNPRVAVASLLCEFEAELTGAHSQVYKSVDDENWDPLSGQYSRSIQWTYQDCSFDGNTSVC
jgi:hypothetical protein